MIPVQNMVYQDTDINNYLLKYCERFSCFES